MSPDLSFNIIHTIYSLWSHNYVVLAYFSGLILAFILSLKHPSRYSILLIIGFALLTFGFEYDKHIVDGLRQQTLTSLITEKPHYTVARWVNLFLGDVLPIIFFLGGWSCIFTSLIIGNRPSKKN